MSVSVVGIGNAIVSDFDLDSDTETDGDADG